MSNAELERLLTSENEVDRWQAIKWLTGYMEGSRRAHDRIILGKLIELLQKESQRIER